MAKPIIAPFNIGKPPHRVEEVDELSFLLGNYGVPIPARARQLILDRAFKADKDRPKPKTGGALPT